MGAAKKSKLLTPSGESKGSSYNSQRAREFLDNILPNGWESYFSPKRAGKYYGLGIVCSVCGMRPSHLKQHHRWRWLAVHEAMHKRVGRG